jgi:3-dehydroquinate synthase
VTEKLIVGLGQRSYPIWVGSGILDGLGNALQKVDFPQRVAVVTNQLVNRLYGERVIASLAEKGFSPTVIELPDGEEFKTIQTLEMIFDKLIRQNFDRTSGLIALGGGVIGDITGFAAATFLRGIPFAQAPTTLLSQVDSSVGGKTGVNHPLGKNLIGAFYQPMHVHIDVDTLQTLPSREFSSGMAEVIKYGMIRDKGLFDWLFSEREALQSMAAGALVQAVKRSCQIKADVVELDEKEDSLRAVLNYGHTFGHAVETLSGYGQVKHGEAVAIGMVVAAAASVSLNLCKPEDLRALCSLLGSFGLPVAPPSFPLPDYLRAMGRDKKIKKGTLRLILNQGIGGHEIRDIPDPESLFRSILESPPCG